MNFALIGQNRNPPSIKALATKPRKCIDVSKTERARKWSARML